MRVASINTMRGRRTISIASLEIDWMCAVAIDVGQLIVVEVVRIPEGLGIVVAQSETVEGFRKAINIVVWYHRGDELEELVFENDLLAVCTEDSLARPNSGDLELEARIVGPGKRQVASGVAGTIFHSRLWSESLIEDVQRFVVRSQIFGSDADSKSALILILHRQKKVLNVVAVHVTGCASQSQIGLETCTALLYIGSLVAGTYGLCVGSSGVKDVWENTGCIIVGRC